MKDRPVVGSIVIDSQGTRFRVLEIDDEGIWMIRLPLRKRVIYTRTVSWEKYERFDYKLEGK